MSATRRRLHSVHSIYHAQTQSRRTSNASPRVTSPPPPSLLLLLPLLLMLPLRMMMMTVQPELQSPRRSSGMSMLERGAGAEPGAGGRFAKGWKTALTSAAIGLALAGPMLSLPGHAGAAEKRAVGEISASGLVFKVSKRFVFFIGQREVPSFWKRLNTF